MTCVLSGTPTGKGCPSEYSRTLLPSVEANFPTCFGSKGWFVDSHVLGARDCSTGGNQLYMTLCFARMQSAALSCHNGLVGGRGAECQSTAWIEGRNWHSNP